MQKPAVDWAARPFQRSNFNSFITGEVYQTGGKRKRDGLVLGDFLEQFLDRITELSEFQSDLCHRVAEAQS